MLRILAQFLFRQNKKSGSSARKGGGAGKESRAKK